MNKKITPCLWFDDRIGQAVETYLRIFEDSRVVEKSHYPDGRILVAELELSGHRMQLLNGGPRYKFTEAISFAISTKDQAETDHYWDQLVADGGEESMCGWLKDRYGVSWQVVPTALPKLIGGPDPAGSQRAMQAMLQMRRLVIADLEKAYAGG